MALRPVTAARSRRARARPTARRSTRTSRRWRGDSLASSACALTYGEGRVFGSAPRRSYRRYFIRIPFHLTALILFPRHLGRSKRQRVQRRELPRPDRLRRGGFLDCARDDRDRALKLEALSKPTRCHAEPGVMLNLVSC